MTTVHHSPPPGATPFAIYEDPEDQEPPSPSEEGDVSFMSDLSMAGADVAIPSIESEHDLHDLHDEPEAYNGSYTSRPSVNSSLRRDSTMTENSFVSSLPSEISVASKPVPPANALESRYSPRKERPPFRNPSSVRAMQMASPAPSMALEAPRERSRGAYKLATPSKSGRSDSVSTTGTRRSRSHRDSLHREYQQTRPSATPQPLPLVLLHVTILPMQMPHTADVMVKIMPEWLVENYKILEEKLQDIVLMRRGLLIQHPRDEYDVLEERILESLELKTPRLLKCGHFVPPDSDEDESLESDDEHKQTADDGTGRGSRMSGGTITAEEDPESRYPTPHSDGTGVCMDCHRRVQKPGNGVGAGTKRWDIKIYAANGLMRAGAWTAAWSEMERCDVEISPWIPHEVRKTLDKRLEQEQEKAKAKALYAAELQRQMEEEAVLRRNEAEEAKEKQRSEEVELQVKIEAEAAMLQKRLEEEAEEKRKLEATLNDKIEDAKEAIRLEFEAQALMEANGVAERFRALEDALTAERAKAAAQVPPVLHVPHMASRSRSRSRHRTRSRSRRRRVEEIPLGTLLKNYFVLQLQDSRNFFILILGALVVFLLTNSNPDWNLPQPSLDVATDTPLDQIADSAIQAIVTSTATMTATSYSTLVITEVQTISQPTDTSSLPLVGVAVPVDEVPNVSQFPDEEPSVAASTPVKDDVASEEVASAELRPEQHVQESEIADSAESVKGNLGLTEGATESPASSSQVTVGDSSAKDAISEEFVTGETITQDPISDDAAVEELVAEEPVAEELVIAQTDTDEPVAEQTLDQEIVIMDALADGAIAAEEPLNQETPEQELLAEDIEADELMPEEVTTQEALDEELKAEPFATEESDAPIEPASSTPDALIDQENGEAETLDKASPETEVVQTEEAPLRSGDDEDLSAVHGHDRDEL